MYCIYIPTFEEIMTPWMIIMLSVVSVVGHSIFDLGTYRGITTQDSSMEDVAVGNDIISGREQIRSKDVQCNPSK